MTFTQNYVLSLMAILHSKHCRYLTFCHYSECLKTDANCRSHQWVLISAIKLHIYSVGSHNILSEIKFKYVSAFHQVKEVTFTRGNLFCQGKPFAHQDSVQVPNI